jgi:hypothetical protein
MGNTAQSRNRCSSFANFSKVEVKKSTARKITHLRAFDLFNAVRLLLFDQREEALIQRVVFAAAGAAFFVRLPDGFHQSSRQSAPSRYSLPVERLNPSRTAQTV